MQNNQPSSKNRFTDFENFRIACTLKYKILLPLSRGQFVDKKAILARLAKSMPLHNVGSIDTRMREFMTVASWLGHPDVPGYKPCKNASIKPHQKMAKAMAAMMFRLRMVSTSTTPSVNAVVVQVNFQTKKIVSTSSAQRAPVTSAPQQTMGRRGQDKYKDAAYALHPGCAVMGGMKKCDVIASHIKPWSQSTDEERLDPNNCVLLSPNLDLLFDRYDIGFDPQTGRMVVSPACQEKWNHPFLIGVPRHLLYKPNAQQAAYLAAHLAVVRLSTRKAQRDAIEKAA